MTWTIWIILGALAGALGVGLGAFGAHGLRERISPENMEIFQTAAHYQMLHALALVGVGLAAVKLEGVAINIAGVAFSVGILCFCGSLYILAIWNVRSMGMLAPVGGVAFIAGWIALAAAAFV